jgi:hypothetical protein
VSSSDRLIERWSSPEGRAVLQRVLQDLHNRPASGMNMPAILEPLEGTEEVEDGLDLRFVLLEGQQLSEVNLYGVDLTGASLAGSIMQRTDARDAMLAGANLEGVDLRGSYLSNADLTGATLKGANLDEAMLDGATLTGANLEGASCRGTYFHGASLDGADLRQADVRQADLGEVSCRGATVLQGALDQVAVPPPELVHLVVETPAPKPPPQRPPQRGRPARGGKTARRVGSRATMGMRRPGPRPRRPAPTAMGLVSPEPPARDWDQALVRLIPMRRQVGRITIEVDGEEIVLYERG